MNVCIYTISYQKKQNYEKYVCFSLERSVRNLDSCLYIVISSKHRSMNRIEAICSSGILPRFLQPSLKQQFSLGREEQWEITPPDGCIGTTRLSFLIQIWAASLLHPKYSLRMLPHLKNHPRMSHYDFGERCNPRVCSVQALDSLR